MSQSPTRTSARRTTTVALAVVLLLLFLAGLLLKHRAEPIARQRIVASLESKFRCSVELDEVHVSFLRGLQVDGAGLRIMDIGNHARLKPGGAPMLSARTFQFATTFGDLVFHRESAITAYVQGLTVTIPAANDRLPLQQSDPATATKPRDSLFLNRIIATDSTLVLESPDPSKPPTSLAFTKLILFDPGKEKPFAYETILTIPVPAGEVHSTGHIGPWQFEDPRQTPVDGNFTFNHADLSTINGLRGTLSSAGDLAGTLGQIAVHGTTDIPNFALDLSAHPFALHTEFQALVDGTTSAVALKAVTAHFLRTTIAASALITRASTPGHNIVLDFHLKDGRAEDLLVLFNRSSPPLLSASVTIDSHIQIPPGKQPLVTRFIAHGGVSLLGTTWSDPAVQTKIDALSLRAQDEHLAKQAIQNPAASPLVTSSITSTFDIQHGDIDLSDLSYKMPGALVLMHGRYPLVGKNLDFHGIARTKATATQLENGFKSLVLKPVSPFLHKKTAGMQLPISLTGDKTHPDFALDLTHPQADKPGAPSATP